MFPPYGAQPCTIFGTNRVSLNCNAVCSHDYGRRRGRVEGGGGLSICERPANLHKSRENYSCCWRVDFLAIDSSKRRRIREVGHIIRVLLAHTTSPFDRLWDGGSAGRYGHPTSVRIFYGISAATRPVNEANNRPRHVPRLVSNLTARAIYVVKSPLFGAPSSF